MMKNDEAVSPVIGVILMVAITVILAAVIAAFVFGLAGTTSTTKNVGLTIALDKNSHGVVTIQGGTDLPQLNNLTYKLNGTATSLGFTTNPEYTTPFGEGNFPVSVGTSVYTPTNVTLSKVSVIGKFKDGTEAVLIERQF
jgi:flagellin-like protein